MKRRPPGRPPIGPPRRGPDRQPPRPSQRLIRANALMANGRHGQAAELFMRLSEGARRRGMPVRAAHLAVRASDALLADGRPQEAIGQLKGALRVFIRRGEIHRASQMASRATTRLREAGFDDRADDLEDMTAKLREEFSVHHAEWEAPPAFGPGQRPVPARGSLPESCVQCGAPCVPDEVVWHHARTAECPYCGSILSAK